MTEGVACNSEAELKLLSAVKSGNENLIQELLSSDPQIVNCADLPGISSSPLHLAAAYGRAAVVDCLLKSGANPDARDNGGQGPLHRACIFGNYEVIKILIENGASVNISDFCSSTPLHEAITIGNVEIVELLIEHGADVDKINTKNWSPLELAKEREDHRIFELLQPNSAIMDAVKKGNARRVIKLLTADNISFRDLNKSTLLHQAAARGYIDIVNFLLMSGADVNAENVAHSTPLHLACCHGRLEIAALLLEYGSSIDAVDKSDFTALHHSALNGNTDICKLLLSHGASSSLKNIDGVTAIELALNADVEIILRDVASRVPGNRSRISEDSFEEDVAIGDIKRYLKYLDMERLVHILEREKITLDILPEMSDDDLSEIGIEEPQTRQSLLGGIEEWRNNEDSTVGVLPLGHSEYKAVEKRIKKCLLSSEYEIIEIKKLQNKKLKERYTRSKDAIELDNDAISNERILFHIPAFLNKTIVENGFDECYTDYSGRSGAGIYFVEQPFVVEKKCFIHNDSVCYICHRDLFLCRVILGKSYRNSDEKLLAHPPPDYHSVTGVPSPGGLKFKEYVVYRREQAYPEYLIKISKLKESR